jgi:hypothetical protein
MSLNGRAHYQLTPPQVKRARSRARHAAGARATKVRREREAGGGEARLGTGTARASTRSKARVMVNCGRNGQTRALDGAAGCRRQGNQVPQGARSRRRRGEAGPWAEPEQRQGQLWEEWSDARARGRGRLQAPGRPSSAGREKQAAVRRGWALSECPHGHRGSTVERLVRRARSTARQAAGAIATKFRRTREAGGGEEDPGHEPGRAHYQLSPPHAAGSPLGVRVHK